MNELKNISEKLIKTDEELAIALTKLLPLEMEYENKKNTLMLQSGMATMGLKEAEVAEQMRTDGITEKYLTAKLEVKILYSRRDTLFEIGRNIRSYNFNDN